MLTAVLNHIASKHVTIGTCQDRTKPLLTRWIFRVPAWVTWLTGIHALYVHHLQNSDEDRALHDHPWPFVTFLASGGYFEHTPEGRFWRPWLSVLRRPAEWQHRLELIRPVWTIVLRGRRFRQWGFIFPDGRWVDWESYSGEHCEEDRVYRDHARRQRQEERC